MGWFDKQVREIKQNDQSAFEESVFGMASVILGKHDSGVADDERTITKAAIDDVLKYFHFKPVDIPNSVDDPDEQLVWSLRPYGMMHRKVKLEGEWYKNAYGPILGFFKEQNRAAALIPRRTGGYIFWDPETGDKVRVNRKTAQLFSDEAVCFYRPLPLKKLGIRDYITYMMECVTAIDVVSFLMLTLLVTLIGMIIPQATKVMTGLVVDSKSRQFLIGTAIFMVTSVLSQMIIESSRSLALYKIGTKISMGVEAAIIARVMNLPADFFRKYSSGDLSYRTRTAKNLCEILLNDIISIGITSIVSLLYVVQIFIFTPTSGMPALIIILLTMAINIIATIMQIGYSRASMEASAKNTGICYELITGVQKIKLSGAEKRAFARWGRAYSEEARYTFDRPFFLKTNHVFAVAVELFGVIVLYYLAVKTEVKPENYLAFYAAFGAVMGSIDSVTQVVLTIAEIKPNLELAEPILKTVPESSREKSMVEKLSGSIELNNVYFRYNDNDRYIINKMNLKIKSGEYIAIVGKTGCGKSTLIRLLLGFETPVKGAIYYDNKDITRLDLRSLRRKIGTVMQDGSLFQGSIFSNIAIAAPQLTLDEAWEAAEIAGIADDIRAMPMGMNTIIAEGQGGISGGQKQRIMIARAIAPKPQILIFDEATSALDNRTQKKISDALDQLKCTRIVIAHRLSTIKNCDRILVLEEGRIIEDGKYDELMEAKGAFYELVERQRLDN